MVLRKSLPRSRPCVIPKQAVAYSIEFMTNLKTLPSKGYVVSKLGKDGAPVLMDFVPYEPKKKEGLTVTEFPDFNAAVDHFFLKLQPIKVEKEDKESIAWKKYENIKVAHTGAVLMITVGRSRASLEEIARRAK